MGVDGQMVIKVQWGPETFTPVAYHTVVIGPFSCEVHVRQGETEEQAFTRAWSFLDRMGQRAYQEQIKAFLGRCKAAGGEAYKTRGT